MGYTSSRKVKKTVRLNSMEMYNVKVGQVVRCYDFRGNENCYVEGVVTEVENYLFTVKAIVEMWDGVLKETNRVIRTHVEVFAGWENRVRFVA
jgi:hypothetical protein